MLAQQYRRIRTFSLTPIGALLMAVALLTIVLTVLWLRSDHPEPSLDGLSQAETIETLNDHPKLARALPVVRAEVDTSAPDPTIQDAVARATLIARGRVSHVEFMADHRAIATIEVDRLLKSVDPPRGLTFRLIQFGGPEVHPAGTVLVESVGAPLLLAGDEAFLFLTRAPADDFGPNAYWPAWPHTSVYSLRSGQIQATDTNPFGSDIEHLTADEFENVIRQIAEMR